MLCETPGGWSDRLIIQYTGRKLQTDTTTAQSIASLLLPVVLGTSRIKSIDICFFVESWDWSLNHYNVSIFGIWRPLFRDLNNRGAVISILLAQLVSASYFYTASSVYSYMASDLGGNVSGLGVLTTAFILGIGPLQVPAGILSAK